jgi:hypothetical protein
VAVVGGLRWVPAPWPWPLPAAVALALLVLAAARHRRWPLLLAGLTVLLVAADAAHTAGGWAAATPGRAAFPLLLAVLGVAIVSGPGGLSSVTRSQLAVALPDLLARGLLAVIIGLGTGLALAALLRVRSLPPVTYRRWSSTQAPSRPR